MKQLALVAACAALLRAQAQLPVNPLPPDTVVAVSDGRPITAGEITRLLEGGDRTMIALATQNPDEFLGSISVLRYLAGEGKKLNLADESPLKEQLQYVVDGAIASAMLNRIRESYAVPEQAINDFYAQNQSRYEMARIKVIAIGFCPAVSTEGGQTMEDIRKKAEEALAAAHCSSKRTEEQAHDVATGLVGRLRGGGGDFVKFVAQYSEDPDSKATDGDFGLVTRDNSMPQEIKNAVFSLKPDDVSDPIRSGTFFYIIKIKEKTVQPLSNVHEAIIQELKQKHFAEFMADLHKRFKPVIERNDFFTTAVPKSEGAPQLIQKP